MSAIAASLIASAIIAAGTATSQAVIQKKQSDEQNEYNRKRQRDIDAKAAQENAWYRMQYYQDPLRTQNGANMLRTISDYNQRMIDKQRSLGYITGATHEQSVATMGQAMQNYGKTIGDIKSKDDERKANVATAWQKALDTQFSRQQSQDSAIHQATQQSMTNAINNINAFSKVAQSTVAGMMNPSADNYNPDAVQKSTQAANPTPTKSQIEASMASYKPDYTENQMLDWINKNRK